MKTNILLVLTLIFIQNSFGQLKRYSPEKIAEDFEYLYKNLEASHYELYTSISKKDYDKEYKRILVSIKESMTSTQALRLFQPFVALDRHAHCYIVPFKNYGEYYDNDGTVFPFNLCLRGKKAFITNNFSTDSTIFPGDEIISINGKPMNEIMKGIHLFISGESDYLKDIWIEMVTFPRSYWIVYDRSDTFNLKLRNKEGKLINTSVDAIPAEDFESKNAMQKPLIDNEREFRFLHSNIAYLHPGGFINLNAKDVYETADNRAFMHFIDSSFLEIKKSNPQSLVIDLRNNGGGINNFSDYMLTYIADKPFKFSNKFMVRTSELTKEFWKNLNDSVFEDLKNEILTKENGSRFEYKLPFNQPRADSLRFNGKVYVLINRYVMSQAVLTAAMVQDYKFGILVGEKTGDYSSLFGSIHSFKLPNTKLEVMYPKAFIVRPNGDEKAKNVVPDYKVEEILFNDKDEILNYTLDLIKNSEN